MSKEEAVNVLDRFIDDSSALMSRERWVEFIESLKILLPESKFSKDDR